MTTTTKITGKYTTLCTVGYQGSVSRRQNPAAAGGVMHIQDAMLGSGRWSRDQLRVDSLGGRRGNGMGRAEWEREYYGDVLRRIEAAV